MNILFVLYGDFTTNTANPLVLFTRELQRLGHECVIAIPDGIDTAATHDCSSFTPILFDEILSRKGRIFPNGLRADIVHACTPRIVIGEFLKQYQKIAPTPLVIYLEDNESWITKDYLGFSEDKILQLKESELRDLVPEVLSHPFEYPYLISLADLTILIQEKLRCEISASMPYQVIPWGVKQDIFHPNVKQSQKWRDHFSISEKDKIIVYHGGLNGFTRPAMIDLCRAIELINQQGISCKLIRTGNNPINFWEELDSSAKNFIFEAGVVEKEDLPSILALADLYVQPGRINPFEDLRLPSKLPEFLSMGKPVILPNVNIASLFNDGSDALLLEVGDPREIAQACINVFQDKNLSKRLGINARIFSQIHFNLEKQVQRLVTAYQEAIGYFDAGQSKEVWSHVSNYGFAAGALLKVELEQIRAPEKSADLVKQLIDWEKLSINRISALSSRWDPIEMQLNSENLKPHQSSKGMLHKFLRKITSLMS